MLSEGFCVYGVQGSGAKGSLGLHTVAREETVLVGPGVQVSCRTSELAAPIRPIPHICEETFEPTRYSGTMHLTPEL